MELQNTVQESSNEKLISNLATAGSVVLRSMNNCIIGTNTRTLAHAYACTHTHTYISYIIRNIIS